MSALLPIKVSAPGSMMITGEHAVLHGATAVVSALDKRMHVTLQPRDDRHVHIDSALAQYASTLDALSDEPRLSFLITAIRHWLPELKQGFDLEVRSEFSHTVGLGSSAALVAALTLALETYTQTPLSDEERFKRALSVVHEVQNGRGSGADLAASLYGGLIAFTVSPLSIERLPGLPSLGLWYVGYKMKTPDVLAYVEQLSTEAPELYQELDLLMQKNSAATVTAIREQNWLKTGQLLNFYHGLMDALGVCDAQLAALVYRLREGNQVLGAKISGSGLGDCAFAFAAPGETFTEIDGFTYIPVAVSAKGAQIE